MKKIRCFLILVVIALFLALSIVLSHAEESNPLEASGTTGSWLSKLEINPDTGLPTGADTLTDAELRKAYLKREWGKILNNSEVGPYINQTQYYLKKADPAFIVLLGVRFTFSWIFILTLILYIILLDIGFDIVTAAEARLDFFGENWIKLVKWGLFFIYFVLISSIRVAYYLASFIISWISGDFHWLIQLLLLGVVIVAILLIPKIFSEIRKFFKADKKDRDLKETKRQVKKQKKSVEKELEETNERVEGHSEWIRRKEEDEDIANEAREDASSSDD